MHVGMLRCTEYSYGPWEENSPWLGDSQIYDL